MIVAAFNTQVGTDHRASVQAASRHFLFIVSGIMPFLGALLGDSVSEVYAQTADERPLVIPYLSVFLTRAQPTGGRYSYLEDNIPSLTVDGGTGGGAKVGGFFRPFNYAFGFELEAFGHGGKLSAPQTMNGGVTRFVNQDFTMVNLMANVLARYRGDLIQPYVGGGVGFAAVFTDGQAQSKGGLQSGAHGLTGVAAQAIAGARLVVTQHVFVFAEYKYLVSYTDSDPCGDAEKQNNTCQVLNELSYQSHYAAIGIGFSFY